MESRELLGKVATTRTRLALAGDKDRSSTREHIQAAPLLGQQQRIAYWCTGKACRSQFDPFGLRGKGSEQHKRL
jgi:hypothetical protein